MADWWQSEDILGHVNQVVTHINNVRMSPAQGSVQICRSLFDALNSTWTAFNNFQEDWGASDHNSFRRLLLEGAQTNHIQDLLQSKELQNLIEFEPQIMNHDLLRRRGYRPGQSIEPHLRREASREHQELANAYRRHERFPSRETAKSLLKKIAGLLYVVRSNIAHGEKEVLANPNSERALRDEKVSKLTIPVQLALLECIFDMPSQKLIVYGMLAPDAPGEYMLQGIEGTWQQCKVPGSVYSREGLRYYKRYPETGEIECQMFSSVYLPEKWASIDTFEGEGYHRLFVPAKTADYWVVANIYEGRSLEIY